jgi:hypothetical protein
MKCFASLIETICRKQSVRTNSDIESIVPILDLVAGETLAKVLTEQSVVKTVEKFYYFNTKRCCCYDVHFTSPVNPRMFCRIVTSRMAHVALVRVVTTERITVQNKHQIDITRDYTENPGLDLNSNIELIKDIVWSLGYVILNASDIEAIQAALSNPEISASNFLFGT